MNKVSKKSILYNKVSRVVIYYNKVKIEYKIQILKKIKFKKIYFMYASTFLQTINSYKTWINMMSK